MKIRNDLKKTLLLSASVLLTTSLSTGIASANKVHHTNHYRTALVYKAINHHKINKQAKQLYRLGFHEARTNSLRNVNQKRYLINHNHAFQKGYVKAVVSNLQAGAYRHEHIMKYQKQYLNNGKAFFSHNLSFKYGFMAGSQTYPHNSDFYKLQKVNHNHEFKRGFYAGVFNGYGSRALKHSAYKEYQMLGHMRDDITPPYES